MTTGWCTLERCDCYASICPEVVALKHKEFSASPYQLGHAERIAEILNALSAARMSRDTLSGKERFRDGSTASTIRKESYELFDEEVEVFPLGLLFSIGAKIACERWLSQVRTSRDLRRLGKQIFSELPCVCSQQVVSELKRIVCKNEWLMIQKGIAEGLEDMIDSIIDRKGDLNIVLESVRALVQVEAFRTNSLDLIARRLLTARRLADLNTFLIHTKCLGEAWTSFKILLTIELTRDVLTFEELASIKRILCGDWTVKRVCFQQVLDDKVHDESNDE